MIKTFQQNLALAMAVAFFETFPKTCLILEKCD
jgi:hypothetical protein